jgi:PPOX class probable F420-dependent enzyme
MGGPGILRRRRVAPLVRDADLAWVYAAVVVVVAIIVRVLPGARTGEWVLDSSTNLDNLRDAPLLVLGASAFVVAPVSGLWILVPLVVAFGAAQRWLGRAATVIVAVLGHVGATLFVAMLLAAGIARGQLDPAVARAPDVGVSYGLAAVAGLLVARVPARLRGWYVVGLLALTAGPLLVRPNFTELGHTTAVLLGFALALLAVRAAGPVHDTENTRSGTTELLALGTERFLSLSTFRPSGERVTAPVRVVRDGDALLVLTAPSTGKVARLRDDPRVVLRPYGRTGPATDGAAPVLAVAAISAEPADRDHAVDGLRAKYGAEYRIVTTVGRLLRRPGPATRLVLRITPG